MCREYARSSARGIGDQQAVLHLPADPHPFPARKLASVELAWLADGDPLTPGQRELVLDVRAQVKHLIDGRVSPVETVGRRAIREDAHALGPYDEGSCRSRRHIGSAGRRGPPPPAPIRAREPDTGALHRLV